MAMSRSAIYIRYKPSVIQSSADRGTGLCGRAAVIGVDARRSSFEGLLSVDTEASFMIIIGEVEDEKARRDCLGSAAEEDAEKDAVAKVSTSD